MTRKTFSPFQVGGVELPNRIVFAPFETNYATEEGYPTERQIDHYGKIAAGGAGLLIVEAANVNPEPQAKYTRFGLSIHDDRYIDPLRKIVDRIHREGSRAALQIADKSLRATKREPTDLTAAEIGRIVDYFAEAAVRVRGAGFDAVDFHMAHSYTVADFLSWRANKRKDEFGKSVEGRARMALAILQKAREKAGRDYPLFCRINGDEFIAGGNTVKDGTAIAALLAQAGACLIDVSVGVRRDDGPGTYSILRGVPTVDFADGCNVHVAEAIRRAVKVPVIAVGKIRTPQLVEEILQEERADLVALGRPLFADPLFPQKAREGREKEIISCLCCNYCHRLYAEDKIVECVQHRKKKVVAPDPLGG